MTIKATYYFQNSYFVLLNLFFNFCFILLIYQIIDISELCLRFPFEVKLNVIYENDMNLLSATICLPKSDFWKKFNVQIQSAVIRVYVRIILQNENYSL